MRHRELLLIAAAFATLWGVSMLTAHAVWSVQRGTFSDFGLFYYGMQAWRDGGSFYSLTPAAYGQGAVAIYDLAPPHLHLLFWPFALLGPTAAYLSFIGVNLFAIVACIWWTSREMRASAYAVPMVAFVLGTHAAKGVTLGQYTPLLAVAATAAWLTIRRDRWTHAAGWLGLLISIKPFALVFTAYAVKRGQWRAALLSLAVAAGIYACGAAFFGASSYREWMAVLDARAGALAVDNPSIFSLWTRLQMPAIATALSVATILGGTWWRFDEDVDRSILAGWLAAFLVSPIAWSHYYLLAVGPVVALAVSGRWARHPLAYLAGAALLVDLWAVERWHSPIWDQSACMIALLWWAVSLTTPATRLRDPFPEALAPDAL